MNQNDQKTETIVLYFKFSIGKEIYIDTEENLLFSEVIN